MPGATAKQELGEMHDTADRPSEATGGGGVCVAQVLPFQSRIRLPRSSGLVVQVLPTATQALAVGQETPDKFSTWEAGAGTCCKVHCEPFQC